MSAEAALSPRRKVLPNSVLGTTILVFSEAMFFSGLISAFIVIRASNAFWAIPPGVVLPIYETALNTLLLFISGVLLFYAGKLKDEGRRRNFVVCSAIAGLGFVAFQGVEWIGLITAGLNLYTGIFGALFFLIVGAHALHAASGALLLLYFSFKAKTLSNDVIHALQIFWFFIVGIWPVIYYLIYLD